MRVVLASLFVAASFASSPAADGQTPAASVPRDLFGTWTVKSGSLNPADRLVLTGDSAKIQNSKGETLGYLTGTLRTQGAVDMGVLWTLHAFQLTDTNLTEKVWKDAIADHGDGGYNMMRTTWNLWYDAKTDEIVGNYVDIKIHFDDKKEVFDQNELLPAAGIRLARDLSACSFLTAIPGQTTARSKYQPWVKALLCQYLTSDFGKDFASRTSFVEAAISALETRAPDPKIGVSGKPTVVHIVTYHPAVRGVSQTTTKPVIKAFSELKIATSTIRSLNDPDKAVAGFADGLFLTPKPAAADAEAHAPQAETALLAVYNAKKFSDLIHDNPNGMQADVARGKFMAALTTFKSTFVTAAEQFDVNSSEVTAKPAESAENAPAAVALSEADAKNVILGDPGAKGPQAVPIDTLPDRVLGRVTLVQAVSKKVGCETMRDNLENIESIERYDGGLAVGIAVRIQITIAKEVPSNIVSKDKKVSCTANIAAHEQKHVDDTWAAWKEFMIDGWIADLTAKSFPKQLGRRPVAETQDRVTAAGKTGVATDLKTWFYFSNADAAASQADLEKFFTAQDPVRKKAFIAECENVMDNNCNYEYVKGASDDSTCDVKPVPLKVPR